MDWPGRPSEAAERYQARGYWRGAPFGALLQGPSSRPPETPVRDRDAAIFESGAL